MFFFLILSLIYAMMVRRVGDQSVLVASAAGRQDGGQETDQGGEARQGRAPPDQHRLDVDRRTRVERQVGPR